ncbi:MAG: hypothetical protein WCG83_00730 [Candidatus Peregrinibacteria bacterium]
MKTLSPKKPPVLCDLCREDICPECGGCGCEETHCACDLLGEEDDDEEV